MLFSQPGGKKHPERAPCSLLPFSSFPFSCKNLIDLRKHLDTHSKEPAYRCEFEACSFTARSLCSIKLHYRKVHEVGPCYPGKKSKKPLNSCSAEARDQKKKIPKFTLSPKL